jgi:hypothetical protein
MLYDRLKRMWIAQRKPGQVILGDQSYEVMTPNGDDAPVFVGRSNQLQYESFSYKPVDPAEKEQPKAATPGRGKSKRGNK